MNILSFNKHWQNNYFYNFKIKRLYFGELINKIETKYIDLLIGLRRVGKTTLMFQSINHLIEKGIERDNILYYSFDDEKSIENIINEYLKLSNKDILKDKIYIFFDEIQKVEDWQNKIKVYYDLYPNIKFVLSGSSSLFLKGKESLAGRIFTMTIKPLFFTEFLEFKGKSYLIEKPNLFEKDLILEFEKYLYRQFYDTIDLNIIEAKNYTNSLKNKIIKEDARDYFDIKYPDLLLKIFDIIASNPGMIIDYTNLGNDLGIDSRTVQTYIYYLEESFLLNRVYNFSKNLLTSEKKQKKVYLNSTSFFAGNGEITGELFENYIQNHFDFKYFYRFNKYEVDFVGIDDLGNINAFEVKYKENLGKNDFSGLDYFSKNFKVHNNYILSKNIEKKLENTLVFPFWLINNLNFNNSK